MMYHEIFDIIVGTEVYLRPYQNAARHATHVPIRGIVTKIARKYFYVTIEGHSWEVKFEKTTFKSVCEDCNSSYGLYPSMEAYNKQVQKERQLAAIEGYFRNFSKVPLSDNAIRCIYECLMAEGAIVT